MPTLLQIASLHPDAQARLAASHTLLPAELPMIDDAWLAAHAPSVDGIVTGGHLGVPPSLMTALPNLRVIGINGVGYDKIDLELARSRGVRVANTPDVLTEDVADLAIGLTLALLRRLPQAHAHVQEGALAHRRTAARDQAERQADRDLRIGPIGRAVAKRLIPRGVLPMSPPERLRPC